MGGYNSVTIFILFCVTFETWSVSIPDYLQECYKSEAIVNKENLLPRNIFTVIDIIRKIERDEHYTMTLPTFSTAFSRRFRADGIMRSPDLDHYREAIPYYLGDFPAAKLIIINELIPGKIDKFPNDSISYVERCSLHSMISTNINRLDRGDESNTCKVVKGSYHRSRYFRDLGNRGYSVNNQYSDCPTEDGTVLTNSGTVNLGAVIAGIASGLDEQFVTLKNLLRNYKMVDNKFLHSSVDNRWFSTLTGDLAEVTLRQGPLKSYNLGVYGNWNSTTIPKWYFISKGNNLPVGYEFTAAELKGGMDGLILSQKIKDWYSRYPNLKLSQILDMYYSSRGVFEERYNSCNRHQLFNEFFKVEKLREEILVASRILDKLRIAEASFNEDSLQTYSMSVANEFTKLIEQVSDVSTAECRPENSNFQKSFQNNYYFEKNHPSVDLTIFVDTNWNFETIRNLLVQILQGIEVGQYNSNFTIFNAKDGSIIVNSTNSITDFHIMFNQSYYERLQRGTKMAAIFGTLDVIQPFKLRREKDLGLGGQNSDIVLIMPHGENDGNVQDSDLYYNNQMERIQREVPDCVILFFTNGNVNRWTRFVFNTNTDLYSFNMGKETAAKELIHRITLVPKRLINSQCGDSYQASGSTLSFDDYIEPTGVKFYRIHANYFFTSDEYREPTIKIQVKSSGIPLEICTYREPINSDTIERIKSSGGYCRNFTGNSYISKLSCNDHYLIQDCQPYYFSVRAFDAHPYPNYSPDEKHFRYPDMIKYTISYENLVCRSSGIIYLLTPMALISMLLHYWL